MGDKHQLIIGNRRIGSENPAYIIAEMSANHAGDLAIALEIVHAAKEAGADCIKLQTYTPATMTIDSEKEYFLIKKGLWKNEKLFDLYGKACMPWEWQPLIKEEAEKIGLDFLSTPSDKNSVDFLEDMGVLFYKIGSFEVTDLPLVQYIALKNKPVIMSIGMASLGEIEEAVAVIRSVNCDQLCLLKCSSAYPAIPDHMNLRTLPHLSATFDAVVGLSDHSLGAVASITAVALGAKVIEKHFCLDRKIDTPDVAFSMEPQEFKNMVRDIRSTEKALGKISYEISDSERENRQYRRSIFVVADISKGDFFTEENIKIIRPAQGLLPKYMKNILGKRAAFDIEKGTPLQWNMVE